MSHKQTAQLLDRLETLEQENKELKLQIVNLQQKFARLDAELSLGQAHSQPKFSDRERACLLSTIAQVANLLLRSPDYITVLPEVVRLLGEAVGSDRAVVMQDIGLHPTLNLPAIKTLVVWCKSGVTDPNEATLPVAQAYLWEDVPESYETLARGEVFNRLIADLQEPGRSLLAAQGNTSCLFVPIVVNRELWGLIGFDNCGEPRLYDETEIATLKIAAIA